MTSREHAVLRLALDLAILTVRDNALQVLTITRGNAPFRSRPALPGGFLRDGEDLLAAAVRELREETALDGEPMHLEQLSAYGAPERDPRGRVVSVAYLAIVPDPPDPEPGSDAASAAWMPVARVRGRLAFDHDQILDDAVERVRSRLEFTTLATAFCGSTFTIGDIRNVYEVVWGRALDPRNFNRKVINTVGFVEPTGQKRIPHLGRPAVLYRHGGQKALNPPILRSHAAAA
ncbi:NUDIX hydrolase [Actinoplanes utahensis]|uniref:NUDIX hydrolase n=1 Tax=Actinoplanes utahensis TaxID=1869 RepID=A0A0A6UGP6_ACTUT|nr:NUDIX domain-containing protein [Actinoplanes utahensis]KHD74631.1 NUDIX hydrolase [Actinoplanes utahensis]GIF31541.1 NUDIX hydrolase [Actinoplanes utahensis]